MRRTTPALIAALVVVGSLAAFPAAGLAVQTTETTENSTNETNTTQSNATISPGEQLAGVVGVQKAELEGEVDSRAYGVRVAQSANNDSRAGVVAAQLDDLEQRLDDLEQRRQDLEAARENGSMSEGQYRARMARLAAETRTVDRLANQSNETARGLPAETLEANGINASTIRELRDRANALGGPAVAEIARSIAGDDVGNGFGPGQAGERGTDMRGNQTDGADRGGDARGSGQNERTPTDG